MTIMIKDKLKILPMKHNSPEEIPARKLTAIIASWTRQFLEDLEQVLMTTAPPHPNRRLKDEKYRIFKLSDLYVKINKFLVKQNRNFRQYILKKSPNYKKETMYVMSYNARTLDKIIEKRLNFNFCWSDKKRSYDKRTKVNFNFGKFTLVLSYAYAFLFAKYQTVYEFQYDAVFLKVIIAYFDPDSIKDVNDVYKAYNAMKEFDFSAIIKIQEENGLIRDINAIKVRKSQPDKYPTIEDYDYWLNIKNIPPTKLQKRLAETYGVSERTIKRDMARKGFSNKKYIKKSLKQEE